MINKDFKIIFYLGGFAGDLLTVLYNPDLFKKFDKKTIILNKEVIKLKSYKFRQAHSYNEKIEYLKSIEPLGVCSNHDGELSLRLKNNVILVHCSDYKVKFFYERQSRYNDDQLMSFEEYMAWQETSKKIYKRQVDLANIDQLDFLKDININNIKSETILKQWLELNKHEWTHLSTV